MHDRDLFLADGRVLHDASASVDDYNVIMRALLVSDNRGMGLDTSHPYLQNDH